MKAGGKKVSGAKEAPPPKAKEVEAKAPDMRQVIAKVRDGMDASFDEPMDRIRYAAVTHVEGAMNMGEEYYTADLVPLSKFAGKLPGVKDEASAKRRFEGEGWSVNTNSEKVLCLEVVRTRDGVFSVKEEGARRSERWAAAQEARPLPKATAGAGVPSGTAAKKFGKAPPK